MCKDDDVEEQHDVKQETVEPPGSTRQEPEEERNNDKQQKSLYTRLCEFYQQQEFLLLILFVIGLARAYPKLGADYLQPHITATWVAVVFIFLLSGISLRTSELVGVLDHWKFHILVQLVSLGAIPAVVFGISRALADTVISRELADGMVNSNVVYSFKNSIHQSLRWYAPVYQ